MATDFQELVREGRLGECRELLTAEVKKNPSDAKLRIFLFQLLAVLGEWGRAGTQLDVAAELEPKALLLKAMYGPALAAEPFRDEVCRGLRAPVIFGEPEAWMSWLVQANQLQAEGKDEAAAELRDKAFEEAPATGGTIDGDPFVWIADADTTFGPMVEAIINNTPYWVPFLRIQHLEIEPPTDLRDLIWAVAQFKWTNGGETHGLIPVRYPGSAGHDDSGLALARKTDWIEGEGGLYRGVGQRLLATDGGEKGILETRRVLLGEAAAAGATADSETAEV
jgi:type VI secretion system protein ImpE